LAVSQDKYKGDFKFKIKTQKADTLNIVAVQKDILNLREQFTLETATPLTKFENLKIKLVNKDSVSVDFTTKYDEFYQRLFFDFKKEPSEKYTLTIMPDALKDYMGQPNDTLIYRFNTKTLSDYGNLRVNLQNVKHFPVIVELLDSKGEVIASEYSENNTKIDFNLVEPTLFNLRVIYDDNKNRVWDTGNYLEKRQAEEVVYFSKDIDVRANWDVEQVFDLNLPYAPEQKKKVDKNKKDNTKKSKSSMGF
jgi:hypothetical protein